MLGSDHRLCFPDGSDDKESTCNSEDPDSIPGSLQYSCLENSTDRGAYRAIGQWGHKKLDTTEPLSAHTHTHTHTHTQIKTTE